MTNHLHQIVKVISEKQTVLPDHYKFNSFICID